MSELTWDDYYRFVVNRHRAWERRADGEPRPWSEDPIIDRGKFTNVFRALDPGSQYAMELLMDCQDDDADLLTRAVLYRYTNRPEGWEHFREIIGRYPIADDAANGTLTRVWIDFRANGGKLQSTAYRVFAPPNRPAGQTYIEWLSVLVQSMLGDDLLGALRQREGAVAEQVKLFDKYPRCGPFMGQQILTDLGYVGAVNSGENVYAVPGIGAHTGARALGLDANAAIHDAWLTWAMDGKVQLHGETPSMMDVQNTFCEFGKYARMRTAGKLSMPFRPTTDQTEPRYVLPARWGARGLTEPRTRREHESSAIMINEPFEKGPGA